MILYKYLDFINENFYDDFKKTHFKLFNDSDEDIKSQLATFLKRIDNETDYLKVVNTFDNFLSSNQNTLNSKIDNNEGQESINKILSDNLKAIFFTLRSVQIKLDDKDFTDTFEQAKDKNFKNLMNMKRDKFSDAYLTYVKDYMIPQIKKMSGIEEVKYPVNEANEVTQPNVAQPTQDKAQNDTQTEPETKQDEPQNQQLDTYKEKSKEWFNYIYGMIWDKLKTIKNKFNTNKQVSSNIDQLSILMKNSNNEDAKKQLLKKITTLSKEGLDKLGNFLRLNKEELGEF